MSKFKSRLLAVALSAVVMASPFAGLGTYKAEAASTAVTTSIPAGSVNYMIPNSDGSKLLVGHSNPNTEIRLYDVATDTDTIISSKRGMQNRGASFAPNGKFIIWTRGTKTNTSTLDTRLYKYDIDTKTETMLNNDVIAGIPAIDATSTKVAYLAKVNSTFVPKIYDLTTGTTTDLVLPAGSTIPYNANLSSQQRTLLYTPDGKSLLISYQKSNKIGTYKYDLDTGTFSTVLTPTSAYYEVSGTSSGQVLMATNYDGSLIADVNYGNNNTEVTGGIIDTNAKTRTPFGFSFSHNTQSSDWQMSPDGSLVAMTGENFLYSTKDREVVNLGVQYLTKVVGLSGDGQKVFLLYQENSFTGPYKLVIYDTSELMQGGSFVAPATKPVITKTVNDSSFKPIDIYYTKSPTTAFVDIIVDGKLLKTVRSTALRYSNNLDGSVRVDVSDYPLKGEVEVSLVERNSKGSQTSDPVTVHLASDLPAVLGDKSTYQGNYVNFMGQTWTIIGDNYLLSTTPLGNKMAFSPNGGYKFDPAITGNVGQVLNDWFINHATPEEQNLVELYNWHLEASPTISYDVKSYVGMLSSQEVLDLEFNRANMTYHTWEWVMNYRMNGSTPQTQTYNMSTDKYVISSSSSPNDIRPTLHLKPTVKVVSGEGNLANPFVLATSATPSVPAPTNLKVSEVQSDSLKLTWDAVTDATSYKVYKDGNLVNTVTGLEYTLTGLNPDTEYNLAVEAIAPAGNSPKAELKARTSKLVLDSPANLRVLSTTSDSIKIGWDADDHADVYEVKRGGSLVYAGPLTEFEDTGLPSDTEQVYTVVAKSGNVESAPATVTGKTKQITVPYPANFTVTNVTYNKVDLQWDPVPGADYVLSRDGQEIFRGQDTSYSDLTMTSGYKVVYSLVAVVNGVSSQAVIRTVDVPAEPQPGKPPVVAPVLKVVRVGFDRVSLEWTPSDDAEIYELYRNDVLIAKNTLHAQVDIGVAPNSDYTYKVVARNEFGQAESNVVSVTTPNEPQNIVLMPAPPQQGTITFDFQVVYGADGYVVERNPQVTYTKNPDGTYHKTYYNTATGETKDLGDTTDKNGFLNFTEEGVDPAKDYHYSITAFVTNPDGSRTEIGKNETTVTTPSDGSGATIGGTTDPGNGGTTDPGNGSNTDPGNGGNIDPGNTNPGNGGNIDPGSGGTTDPGNGGNTDGSTNPGGNGGSTNPGGTTGGNSSGSSGNTSGGSTSGSTVTPPVTDSKEPKSEDSKDNNAGKETPDDVNSNVEFSDVAGHYAEKEIKYLANKGVLKGYANGTFGPNNKVTRAEFAIMLKRALGLEATGPYNYKFKDFDVTSWYALELTAALQNGLTKGFSEYVYKPNAIIPREQAAIMISNVLRKANVSAGDQPITFSDSSDVVSWAAEDVKLAASLGIIKGYEDNSFKPKNEITRAETAVIIYRVLQAVK